MVDYLNELRENCLEAYTGIVQGLKGENGSQCKGNWSVGLPRHRMLARNQLVLTYVSAQVQLLLPHADAVVNFLESISQDSDRSDGVVCAACGLIGYVQPRHPILSYLVSGAVSVYTWFYFIQRFSYGLWCSSIIFVKERINQQSAASRQAIQDCKDEDTGYLGNEGVA